MGIRWNYTGQIVEELRPLNEHVRQQLNLSEEAVTGQKMKTVLDELKPLKAEK